MSRQEIAQKLLEFYAGDSSRWTKEAYARDENGIFLSPYNDEAVCWCLLGACKKLGLEAGELYDDFTSITYFNDAPSRTFEQIQAKLTEWANESE